MPVYRVNNVGSVGFVDPRDRRPYELPPQGWSFVQNARMLNQSAISVDPWLVSAAHGSTTPQAIDFYTPPSGAQHIYVYADDKIVSISSAGQQTVSKVGLTFQPYPQQVWITSQLNGIPLATNNADSPQCFYNAGGVITPTTLSQDFPDWGAGGVYQDATAKIVVGYKNFIVALNIVDVNAFPNLVAWSDAADPGLMPDNWDYTSTTSLSGRTTLGQQSGAILAAEVLRDTLYIYCEYETWAMDFVGGAFVMRFRKVFDNTGIFGPRCYARFLEKHFVLTKSDVIVHDGQQAISVADERVRNRIFETLEGDDVNRLWVSPYLRFSEMWIGVPSLNESGAKEIAQALVWQWEDNTWSVRDLPVSGRHMKESPVVVASTIDDNWDTGLDEGWDLGPDNIWNAGGEVGDLRPLVASTDQNLYQMDTGSQTEDTILRRQDINLSNDQASEMAVAVYPRMRGQNQVEVRVGASNTVESESINWGRWQTYNPLTDYHVTVRESGRRHAIEFKGKGFDLEGYDIEYTVTGRR